MVYKFDGQNESLEIEENSFTTAIIKIAEYEGDSKSFELNKAQIYDLKGALHSIQAKLNKSKNV